MLNLPVIAPDDIEIALSDREIFRFEKGEILHKGHWSKESLDSLKQSMGTNIFNAQYQQAPVPETGNMLKLSWLKEYQIAPTRTVGDQIVQSWDTAIKATDASDYTVCLTFLVRNKNEYYLIDVLRERLEFPELGKLVGPHASRFGADAVLIEEHASGANLVQIAKRSGVQGVIPIKHQSDKVSRMMGASPKIESGSLILPQSAPWLSEFLIEYLAFPRGKHDDQMDALSQFLNWRFNQEGFVFEADFGYDEQPGAPDPDFLLWKKQGGY